MPAGEVERDDDQRRDRVALDELAGPVHRARRNRLRAARARACGARRRHRATPACTSASIAICLPGIASSVKRAETSATRCEPVAMTMNWIVIEDREDDQSDDDVSAHDERAEGRDDRADPARRVTLREDQPRRARRRARAGTASPAAARAGSRELERLLDAQAHEQHERRAEDVDAEQHVEQTTAAAERSGCRRSTARRPRRRADLPLHGTRPSPASAATTCATAT